MPTAVVKAGLIGKGRLSCRGVRECVPQAGGDQALSAEEQGLFSETGAGRVRGRVVGAEVRGVREWADHELLAGHRTDLGE